MGKHKTAQQKKDSTVYGRKGAPLVTAIKDVDMTKRIVTGFYNSLYYFDSDWDVSLPGCYSKTIADRGPNSDAVAKFKMLRNHDWDKAISRPYLLEEKRVDDITGLYFEAKLSTSTAGNDALIDYQEGVIDNHSFGFRYGQLTWLSADTDEYKRIFDLLVNPEDAEGKDGLYAVAEYIGFEGSAVPFGANELTPFLGVKAGDLEGYNEKICKKLDAVRDSIRKGKQSDGHLAELDYKLRQIEQAVKDAAHMQPLKKDTQSGPSSTEEPSNRRKLILSI